MMMCFRPPPPRPLPPFCASPPLRPPPMIPISGGVAGGGAVAQPAKDLKALRRDFPARTVFVGRWGAANVTC